MSIRQMDIRARLVQTDAFAAAKLQAKTRQRCTDQAMTKTTNTLPYALEIYDTRVVSWGDEALLHREWAASLEDAESSRAVWLNTKAGRAGRYCIKIWSSEK